MIEQTLFSTRREFCRQKIRKGIQQFSALASNSIFEGKFFVKEKMGHKFEVLKKIDRLKIDAATSIKYGLVYIHLPNRIFLLCLECPKYDDYKQNYIEYSSQMKERCRTYCQFCRILYFCLYRYTFY